MNVDLKNQLDLKPAQPKLAKIAAISSKDDMAGFMGATSGTFGSAFFGIFVYDDAKKPGYRALQMSQGGLGLPDRDYYLTDAYADKKAAYEVYIKDLLTLAGYPGAEQEAKNIVALETRIAEVSWTKIDSRDDTKTYNPWR